MTKHLILIASAITLLFSFATKSSAQDTLQIRTGFIFVPQAIVNLRKPAQPAKTTYPLSAVVSFSKGSNLVNAMYTVNFNALQIVYLRKLSENAGTYAVGTKSLEKNSGYFGIGATHKITNGNANVFFEIGSLWNEWGPEIHTGIIMPCTFVIK